MASACFFVLAFAAFGASAHPSALCLGLSNLNSGSCLSGLQGFGGSQLGMQGLGCSQMSMQGYSAPTVIHNTCNCLKTILRPQSSSFRLQQTQPMIQTIPIIQARSPVTLAMPSSSGNSILQRFLSSSNKRLCSGNSMMRSFSNSYPSFLGSSIGASAMSSSYPRMMSQGFSGSGAIVVPGSSLEGIINCSC